jgi:hypothetical protein
MGPTYSFNPIVEAQRFNDIMAEMETARRLERSLIAWLRSLWPDMSRVMTVRES